MYIRASPRTKMERVVSRHFTRRGVSSREEESIFTKRRHAFDERPSNVSAARVRRKCAVASRDKDNEKEMRKKRIERGWNHTVRVRDAFAPAYELMRIVALLSRALRMTTIDTVVPPMRRDARRRAINFQATTMNFERERRRRVYAGRKRRSD